MGGIAGPSFIKYLGAASFFLQVATTFHPLIGFVLALFRNNVLYCKGSRSFLGGSFLIRITSPHFM